MSEKFRSKIRKLLALAQSDNPHEAERARVQAEKMMAKHNYSADEVEVITVKATVAIHRKSLKKSEAYLLDTILKISGTEGFSSASGKWKAGRWHWAKLPSFMGVSHDAELAAYTWDVLYAQLEQARKTAKRKFSMNAAALEQYSQGWVYSASEKLTNVFGERKPSTAVDKVSAEKKAGLKEGKVARSQSVNDSRQARDLIQLGINHGELARLNNAASKTTDEALLIGAPHGE
jgi:hypothetical protein